MPDLLADVRSANSNFMMYNNFRAKIIVRKKIPSNVLNKSTLVITNYTKEKMYNYFSIKKWIGNIINGNQV